ncbi:hypothetical protein [Sphingomonas jatrophae]|uniref:Uncharacterized protein n=1 Tax=Sphingomonas jatrophae TaxID=1166337 RepID=A0A1I6LFU5_9SPHN|nr:hypothetical protein [Sphingomonas jatrophae]SFS02359.1 hypothetical protein SAMN05192580_2695 [Sphingomonas jatrophae]
MSRKFHLRVSMLLAALALAACDAAAPPPIDENAGMMISNEVVMSDEVGLETANAAAPAEIAADNAAGDVAD